MYIRCLGHRPAHGKYQMKISYQQLHTDFWSVFSVPFITEGSLFSPASPLRMGSTGCWEEKAFLIQKHALTKELLHFLELTAALRVILLLAAVGLVSPHLSEIQRPGKLQALQLLYSPHSKDTDPCL